MTEKNGAGQSQVRNVTVDPDQAGQRIDNFLRTFLKGVPKTRIYRILRKGEVRVNKQRIKPDYRLAASDVVRIPPVRVAEPKDTARAGQGLLELLEASILFENDQLLIINKPSGLAVHGGSGINLGLIESLRQLRPQARFLELVHRLDRDTSGCVMIAKKRSALRSLHEDLRLGRVDKRYWALVCGQWPAHRRTVEAPLRKNELRSGERVVRVQEDGKVSRTEFRVLRRFDHYSLVEARPVTGRTHQIRVHAQFAGHPIVGDPKYGDDAGNRTARDRGIRRLFLHAAELQLRVPGSGERLKVQAPLDVTLTEALEHLPAAQVS